MISNWLQGFFLVRDFTASIYFGQCWKKFCQKKIAHECPLLNMMFFTRPLVERLFNHCIRPEISAAATKCGGPNEFFWLSFFMPDDFGAPFFPADYAVEPITFTALCSKPKRHVFPRNDLWKWSFQGISDGCQSLDLLERPVVLWKLKYAWSTSSASPPGMLPCRKSEEHYHWAEPIDKLNCQSKFRRLSTRPYGDPYQLN